MFSIGTQTGNKLTELFRQLESYVRGAEQPVLLTQLTDVKAPEALKEDVTLATRRKFVLEQAAARDVAYGSLRRGQLLRFATEAKLHSVYIRSFRHRV